jgi:hypothetical protein
LFETDSTGQAKMNKKYHHSIWVNFIFLPLGLLLLFFGLDQMFLQTGIFDFIINNADTVGGENPKIGFAIAIFLGLLVTSGSIINILKGKKYALEINEQGLIVHTGSLDSNFKTVFVSWENFQEATLETRLSALHWRGDSSSFRGHTGGANTKVLVIKVKPNILEWPKTHLTKSRVFFEKTDSCDKITIDAWLNKGKYKIAEEINDFASNQTSQN